MKLIVGLGNPGKDYQNTYHNLGFMVVDKLAKKLGVSICTSKGNALYGETKYNGEIIFLIKPLTYMNLSGQAVKYFAKYYKLSPQDVIVVCDDIDIPKGTTRYRESGSGGTHNGLKNIVYELKSELFQRVKIGCAREDKTQDLKDYVLSKIDENSLTVIEPTFDEAIQKILDKVGK